MEQNTVLLFSVNLVLSSGPHPIIARFGPVWFLSASFEDTALGLAQDRAWSEDRGDRILQCSPLTVYLHEYLQSAPATQVTKDCVGWQLEKNKSQKNKALAFRED